MLPFLLAVSHKDFGNTDRVTTYLLIMSVPLLLRAAGILSLSSIVRNAVVFRESSSIR